MRACLARLGAFKGVLQLGESSFRGRESLSGLFLLRGAWSWWMSLQILEVPRGFFACLLRRCLNAWGDVTHESKLVICALILRTCMARLTEFQEE